MPAITWHVNGVELAPSPRFVQTVVGEQIVLEIREVTRDDAGIYTCRARSAIGEASTSTALIVSGTPLHLSTPVQSHRCARLSPSLVDVIPRLHDTTGCASRLYNQFDNRLYRVGYTNI